MAEFRSLWTTSRPMEVAWTYMEGYRESSFEGLVIVELDTC